MENKKPKKVAVRKLAKAGEAALVSWFEGKNLNRGYIPANEIIDGEVNEAVLEAAIPNPDDLAWSEIKISQIKPQDVQNMLRNRGIWTADDLAKNLQAASLGLLGLANVNLIALLEFAKKEA